METSPTIKELAGALVKFQKEVGAVKKDATNPFYHSTYATLQSVIDTIREPMAKNGLSFAQVPDGDGLCTILMHTSGEFIKSTGKMTPKDDTPQGQGSAITYMRRYALSAILGIATEDDDDGNAAQPKATTIPRTLQSEPKPEQGDYVCELCGSKAKIAKTSGKPYCPNQYNPDGSKSKERHTVVKKVVQVPEEIEEIFDDGSSVDVPF